MSVYSSVVPIEWKDYKINFMDTPGYVDFAGEQIAALSVADAVVIVVSARNGVESGTMKAYRQAVAKNLPVIFFVTRVDEEHAEYTKVVAELERRCKAVPLVLPIMENGKATGVVNIITRKAKVNGKDVEVPANFVDQVESGHFELCEAVAMTDDALTEKFLMEEDFTDEEMIAGVSHGLRDGSIRPILCGSATAYVGLDTLLDTIIHYFPSHSEKGTITDANGVEVVTSSDEDFSALVFKLVSDNFAQASFVKVMSGTLSADTPLYNSNKSENEKMGSLVLVRGKNQIKVDKLECGDIGAILKLQDTDVNETLATKANPIEYKPIEFPKGMLGKAIWPRTRNDEDRLSTGLSRLASEDKSMMLVNNTETREQVLYGLGDQHIDVIVNKLKSRYKVEVDLTEPTVQYRETITGKAEAQGRHKKQSGGAGQFGEVFIRFEPNPEEDEMVFEEEIVGGAVSKNYFPAVESGLREAMNKGVLAGFKVVQVKATLYDGSMHPVDSKEVAFKSAARLAYRKGMPEAKPALLEPIIRAEVQIPSDYVGTIYGDFSKRRGMIMENNAIDEETTVIVAEVPQAEMMSYATELRSMTQGNGSYVQEFLRYERAPKDVADRVIAAAKARLEEDDED
jgi:elongation factor G